MNVNIRRIYNLKEEKKILERSLNLYYFDKKKRAMLFSRLEKVTLELERIKNDENNYNGKSSNQEKPRKYCND